MFLCDYGGSYGTFRNIFTIVARERGGCETFRSGIEQVNLRLFFKKSRRNSDVVQKLVVHLSCNSKMTHSRVHMGM